MICRLCLDNAENLFGLFESEGMALNAVYIVSKHFWFEPKPNDVMSNSICRNCWHILESFHLFYVQIENSHKKFSENITLIKIDPNDMIVPKEDYDNNQNDNNDNSNDDFVGNFETIWNDQNKSEDIALCEDIKNDPETLNKKKTTESLTAKPPVEYNENSNDENSLSLIKEETPTKRKTKLNTKDGTTRRSKAKKDKPKKCRNKKSVEEIFAINKRLADGDDIIAKFMKVYCNVCTIEQKNFSTLKHHSRVKHKQKGFVVCCDKKYYRRFQLVDHIEKHLNPESYKCSYCGKVSNTRFTLRVHIAKVHEKPSTYKCIHPGCEKVFKLRETFQRHKKLHSPNEDSNEDRKYKCLQCDKKYVNKSALDCHIRIIHDGIHGGVCDICGKIYKSKNDAKNHRIEVHEGGEKQKYKCSLCSEEFSSRYYLNSHRMEVHSNGKSNKNIEHKCTKCNKISPNLRALRSHIRYMHLTKAQLQCNICNKVFKRSLVLKEHITTHTGEPLYTCLYCPKTFTYSANMHHHIKRIHSKEFQQAKALRHEKNKHRVN